MLHLILGAHSFVLFCVFEMLHEVLRVRLAYPASELGRLLCLSAGRHLML